MATRREARVVSQIWKSPTTDAPHFFTLTSNHDNNSLEALTFEFNLALVLQAPRARDVDNRTMSGTAILLIIVSGGD